MVLFCHAVLTSAKAIVSKGHTSSSLRVAELSFSHNALTGTLPTEFGDLRNIEIFRVNDNKLNGTIPSEYKSKEGDGGEPRTGWTYLGERCHCALIL